MSFKSAWKTWWRGAGVGLGDWVRAGLMRGGESLVRRAVVVAAVVLGSVVMDVARGAAGEEARLVGVRVGFGAGGGTDLVGGVGGGRGDGGVMVPGRWNPMVVRIAPGQSSEQCVLVVSYPQDVTQRTEIVVPLATTPGRELVVPLVICPPASMREVRVELRGERSTDRVVASWSAGLDERGVMLPDVMNEGGVVVGDLGAGVPEGAVAVWRDGGKLPVDYGQRPELASRLLNERAKVVKIGAEEMPVSWAGLDMLDGLVVSHRGMTRLSEAQVEALWTWVVQGGRLVVVMDGPGELRVPAAVRGMVPGVSETRRVGLPILLANRLGHVPATEVLSRGIEMRGMAGWRARLLGEASTTQGQAVLWADGPVGGGMVSLLGFAPELAAGSLELGPGVREKIMAAALHGVMDGPVVQDDKGRWNWQPRGDVLVVNGHLEQSMKLRQIPASVYWGLGLLAVAVVVLVGPVDFLVLGWFKKRAYSWVTAIGWLTLASGVGAILPGLIRTDATQVVSGRVVDVYRAGGVGGGGDAQAAVSAQVVGVYASESQRIDPAKVTGVSGGYFHGTAAEADWFSRERDTDQWTKPALVSVQTVGQEGLTRARSVPGAMRMPRWNLRCVMGQEVGFGKGEMGEVGDGFEGVAARMEGGGGKVVVEGWPAGFVVQGVRVVRGTKMESAEYEVKGGAGGPGGGSGAGDRGGVRRVEVVLPREEKRLVKLSAHDVWKEPMPAGVYEGTGLGREVDVQNQDWNRAGAGELWQLGSVRRRDMAYVRRLVETEMDVPKLEEQGLSKGRGEVMVVVIGERERKMRGDGVVEGGGGETESGVKVVRERVVVRLMVDAQERERD